MSTKKTIRVYAAGGAGTNILASMDLQNLTRNNNIEIFPAYIDTSRSNLPASVEASSTYLFKDLDGSGKVRRENYEVINKHIRDILLQHKPGDFNIVISSASGGSGSVIAPEIVSELTGRGLNVVVLTVGSTASKLEIENTIKTIKSYENIARTRDYPVAMGYYQNSRNLNQTAVDQRVRADLTSLVTLVAMTGVESSGLDTSDISHWLNFPKTTGNDPQLAVFSVVHAKYTEISEELGHIMSVCTLANDKNSADFHKVVEYHCTGILPKDSESLSDLAPIHYLIADGFYEIVVSELNKILSELNEQKAARVRGKSVFDDLGSGTNSGVIL